MSGRTVGGRGEGLVAKVRRVDRESETNIKARGKSMEQIDTTVEQIKIKYNCFGNFTETIS